MMALKARLFDDDSALSAKLTTDDPREHKHLGRQVRHFDHDSWQHERENIALQGNLAKFSQNEDFAVTNKRRLHHTPIPLPLPLGYGIPPFIYTPRCFRADGSHRRRRRILRPIDTPQIVEWFRLPRAAQYKPTGPPDHPVLPQQCAFLITCCMDINRP